MKKLIVAIAFVFFICGCARQTGVIQADDESRLLFTGNIHDAVLTIDGQHVGRMAEVAEVFEYKDGKGVQFALEPGTHRVEVRADGRLLVDRKLYLNNQQTMEVVVP